MIALLRQRRYSSSTFVLMAAAALVVAALMLPMVYLLLRAFTASESAVDTLLRASTMATLMRTAWLACTVTLASSLIAVPMAWLTTRTDLPLRRMWAVLTPLPLVIPSYVGAYLYASALGPYGLLQQLLEQPFGLQRFPSIYGFPGALFTLTMLSYPYMLLSVRAALQCMDPALEEAGRSLGYRSWGLFRCITLPLLRPAIGAGGILIALYSLRDFGAVALMRYDTFTRVIYVQYQSFNRGQAALYACLLIGLTLLILVLEQRTRGRAPANQGSANPTRPTLIVPLGRWRWPAVAFCCVIVGLSLLLPAGMLVYWLVRGIAAGEVLSALIAPTINALMSAGTAALMIVLAAVPVALVMVRRPGRFARLFERLSYSALALPGIAVALALVFFGINYARPLYQTFAMLLLAYAVLFLPQAIGALRSALLQIHPTMEEAARSLGHKPVQVLLRVIAPLMRPGLIAGVSLVFLTVMKELPATLLLAPIGFKTLATEVWSAVSEAFFARAAAPALLIVLLSSLPMAFLMLREQRADVPPIG